MILRSFIVIFMSILCVSANLNIAVIFPHHGKSHFVAIEPLLLKLNEIGHNLTVISHFPQEKPLKNYRDISLRDPSIKVTDIFEINHFQKFSRELKIFGAWGLARHVTETCDLLGSKQIQNFLKEKHNFDIILIEMWSIDCFLGLVPKLNNAPVIGLSSCVIMPWLNSRFGNIDHPGYVPIMFMDYSDSLSFLERVENTLMYILNKILYKILFEIPGNNAVRKYLGEGLPSLWEIARNSSLLLVNTHFTLSRPRPLAPNVIEVGGMHVKEPKKLPKDLEKWISEAPSGVIYLSMGSMLKGYSFPPEARSKFLRVFEKLPQKVLWKWENGTMPGKTDKILTQKWLPQVDVLCHPNVKAYISHGGMLGTTEAVFCGVPTLVLPQYGDQFVNAAALQASGGGIVLDFKTMTEETILRALMKILGTKFQKQAKSLSDRSRDRPKPALETAIYWIEYVARHKGAHFMKTAAVNMPWYQYLLLDVVLFLTVLLAATLFSIYFCIKTILRVMIKKFIKDKTE